MGALLLYADNYAKTSVRTRKSGQPKWALPTRCVSPHSRLTGAGRRGTTGSSGTWSQCLVSPSRSSSTRSRCTSNRSNRSSRRPSIRGSRQASTSLQRHCYLVTSKRGSFNTKRRARRGGSNKVPAHTRNAHFHARAQPHACTRACAKHSMQCPRVYRRGKESMCRPSRSRLGSTDCRSS